MPQSNYPILRAEIARPENFLAPSADKQTRNYDKECSNLYLYIISINIYIYIYIYIYILQYPHHLEVFQPVCYAN